MKVLKVISAVMLSAVTLVVAAQSNPGYVTDGSGQIVKTGSDLCLRTSQWTPELAVKGCDPVVEKRATPVTLSGDVLFAFDSAVLTPAGKRALDALVPQVGGNVLVVGHTDRIGAAAYNRSLSEQRAQSVARYLSVAAKASYAVSGVGSTQPSGKTAQCSGSVNQQLIDCLAPDRRVTLTIIK
jgi:OmpA-OmpF porin, OOP family